MVLLAWLCGNQADPAERDAQPTIARAGRHAEIKRVSIVVVLVRGGRVSANGSCRLIAARGGELALNLPRADDWETLPALLEEEAAALQADFWHRD